MPFIFNDPSCEYPKTHQISDEEWIVDEPFVYTFDGNIEGRSKIQILIPPNFITDYGSIPKIFQNLIEKIGPYGACYIMHDLVYAAELYRRLFGDYLLFHSMKERGACYAKRSVVYSTVCLCGWDVWRKHKKRNVRKLRESINETQWVLSSAGNPWNLRYDPITSTYFNKLVGS